MITQWTLENFKSVAGPETLEFAPLTVLAGANSSGKSTVIQSILLLSQTLRSRRASRQLLLNGDLTRLGTFTDLIHRTTGVSRTGGRTRMKIGFGLKVPPELAGHSDRGTGVTSLSSSLTFKRLTADRIATEGDQADLSRFELVVHSVPLEDVVDTVSGVTETEPVISRLSVSPRFSYRDLPEGLLNQNGNHPDSLRYRCTTRGAFDADLRHGFFARGWRRSPAFRRRSRRLELGDRRFGLPQPGRVHPMVTMHRFGAILRRFLPIQIASWYNSQELLLHEAFEYGLMLLEEGVDESDVREIVDHFENLGSSVMENWLDLFRRIDTSHSNVSTIADVVKVRWGRRQRQETMRELEQEQPNWVSEQMPGQPTVPVMIPQRVPEPFDDAIEALDDYFSSRIGYLGPLREDPRTVYDLPQSGDPQDIGLKGEYTAAVLDANKNVEVQYWHTEEEVMKTGPLTEAVLHWLGYFNMAEGVATTEIGQQGYTLTITDPSVSKSLDLTNVGVGVSQVLPIIVKGLLSDTGSTVIYEQPEIHLHPATQAKIADFFIGLIRSGVQCIIETHSEYFINRIRLRIAEDENDDTQLSELIQILFAERTAGQTSYRPVEVNEYGAIVNWPVGFFDQSQTESEDLIEAAMNKRMENSD